MKVETKMENTKNTVEQCMDNWMDKDARDYTATDMVEALEYELHNIDCCVSNARKLLTQLYLRKLKND